MFWTLYELLINIFQGFLFTWFITKMLVRKNDSPLPYIFCSLLTAAALSSFLLFDGFTWDTWIFVFIIIYSLVFFKDSVWQKLFWNLVLIIAAGSIVGIYYQLFSLLTGADTDRILSSGLPRLLFTLSSNLLLFLSFFLITRLFPEKTPNIRPSFLLLAINILCIFLIDVFFRIHLAYDLPLRWLFIGCFISFAIGVTTVVTNRLIIRYEQEKQTYLFQEQMLKETKSRSEDLQQVYDSMLKLRHDMRSYVDDIQKMAETGDLATEPVYLDELEEQVLPLYSSGNHALDSVLSVKLKKIQNSGIEFRGHDLHYTGGMNIEDYALCSLVSNLLDNAVEALNDRKDRPGERYIYLQFAYSLAGLNIICENPLLGIPPKTEKRSFLSRKAGPYHGLGISIMERIAHDAGGQFNIILSKDLYQVLVLIPPRDEETTDELLREKI